MVFFRRFFFDSSSVGKGSDGEKKVAWELFTRLSDHWLVINDLKITRGNVKSQVDHLLLGPPGIFSLETKNWNTAACDCQGEWLRFQHGMWIPQKSPAVQCKKQIFSLEQILKEEDEAVLVYGIIVFASAGKFDFSEARLPENVMVYGLPGLIEYLNRLEKTRHQYNQRQIERLAGHIYKGFC
ncbi:hypothetical protein N752_21855 [Desulforamulus aquiferis]|nr:hypothetical protein N752_21855 [Desulforamulus aquiferis]